MSEVEVKNLDELKPDPKNPRTMSKHDASSLSNSLTEFGDLSPVVFNVRTQQLVGGHQRLQIMKQLPQEKRVMLTRKFEPADETGTVAVGYIYIGNKQFTYREVDWDEARQRAANIAANRISGEFDLDLLAEINYELSQLENGAELLALTGQSIDELNSLLQQSSAPEQLPENEGERFNAKLTIEQAELVNEALGNIFARHKLMVNDSTDKNGGALYLLAQTYLEKIHNEPPVQPTTQP